MVSKREQDDDGTPTSPAPTLGEGNNASGGGAYPVTGATTAASGVMSHDAEKSDPLPPDHRLTEAEAKAIRAEDRKNRTSPGGAQGVNDTREQMYREPDITAGGESGTQGGDTGREDQNPVGRHK